MKKIILFGILVLSLILISGESCETQSTVYSNSALNQIQESQSEEEQLPVQTLGRIWVSTKNWDADSEIDGLAFTLNPKDINDRLVISEGILNVYLYGLKCIEETYGICMKQECDETNILENWEGIIIKKEDYSFMMGPEVKLEYKKYKLTSDKMAMGCAKVIFKTWDGKSFEAKQDSVFINGL